MEIESAVTGEDQGTGGVRFDGIYGGVQGIDGRIADIWVEGSVGRGDIVETSDFLSKF